MTNVWDAKMASRVPCAALTLCMIMCHHGIDEILDLERKWSIFLLSPAGELNFHFSMFLIVKILKIKIFSRKIRDFEENFSSRMNEIWREFLFLFSNEWDFANRIYFPSRDSKVLREKNHFLLLILPSISLPILVRTRKPLSTTWRICRRRLATMISRRLTWI